MTLFPILVLGAVMLGAGGMLSPAWRTPQPRVGLASVLSFALVSGGAVWWAFAFGWSTLVVDYLFFALLSGVVLGGTLSTGQMRAEARGEEFDDSQQGWTGPQDLFFFAIVGILMSLAVLMVGLPFGTEAVQLAHYTHHLRLTDGFGTLAPYYDITYQQAPIFLTFTAYLSQQLDQAIPYVQLGVGTVTAFLSVWVAYDFGSEVRDKRLGRAIGLAVLVEGGLLWGLFSGEYNALLAVMFFWAFLTYGYRLVRYGGRQDLVGTGLLLGAVCLSDFTLGAFALLIYGGGVVWAIVKRQHPIATLGAFLAFAFAVAPFVLNTDLSTLTLRLEALNVWLLGLSVPVSLALGVLFDRLYPRINATWRGIAYHWAYAGMATGGVLIALVIWGVVPMLIEGRLPTLAERQTLENARTTLPQEAILLNASPNDWAGALSERQIVLLPPFSGAKVGDSVKARAESAVSFWQSPTREALIPLGVTHIYHNQAVAPLTLEGVTTRFSQDGATLYEVILP